MLINEIGVREDDEVVELHRFRDTADPKSRESLTTILASAIAAEEPEAALDDASVIELAPAPPSADGVSHAA